MVAAAAVSFGFGHSFHSPFVLICALLSLGLSVFRIRRDANTYVGLLNPTGFCYLLAIDSLLSCCYVLAATRSQDALACSLLRVLRLSFSECPKLLLMADDGSRVGDRTAGFFVAHSIAAGLGLTDLVWAHERLYKLRRHVFPRTALLQLLPAAGKCVLVVEVNIQLALLMFSSGSTATRTASSDGQAAGESVYDGAGPRSLFWQCWAIFVLSTYVISSIVMARQRGGISYSWVMALCLFGISYCHETLMVIRVFAGVGFIGSLAWVVPKEQVWKTAPGEGIDSAHCGDSSRVKETCAKQK